ncbi:MAG: crossover junction endodeoxyribonuclease RuvC [Patescibacteria group bacterium]|nr:MAG: crossover junction endodeoxyribonuclease RuvC [Patescibacteria group bacterium]
MIFLGIDCGYERTGYAVFSNTENSIKLLDSGIIFAHKNLSYAKRVLKFKTELQKLINKYKPQLAFIEQLFFSKNKTTAIKVAQFQGILILVLSENQINYKLINPNTVKKTITGSGKADKKAIAKMISLELSLKTKGRIDDEIDAIAIAYTGYLLTKTDCS